MSTIATAAEAERAIDEFTLLMEKLAGLLEQETQLVHAGRIRSAAALEPSKAELAGRLFATSERLKSSAKFLRHLAPGRRAALLRAAGRVPRHFAEEHDRAGNRACGV